VYDEEVIACRTQGRQQQQPVGGLAPGLNEEAQIRFICVFQNNLKRVSVGFFGASSSLGILQRLQSSSCSRRQGQKWLGAHCRGVW
jgi:hypothetical protein